MLRSFALLAVIVSLLAGCEEPIAPKADPATPPAGNAGAVANPPAAPPVAAPHQSALERLTTILVDRNKAIAENPRLVELEKNVFTATDPITYASKGYFAAVSTVQMATLKQTIDAHKILNDDKLPTFAEFDRMLKDAGMKLQGLYRWQVYGYDDQTGAISILEDRDKKRDIYEKAGLEFKE